ncbi:MAG: nucleoside-diphosphate kinase [Candidatus Magasanikbacteria bacterium]
MEFDNFEGVNEKTLVLIKPDAVQRGKVGEVIHRLEKKGLKIVGLKFMELDEDLLRDHYSHHVDKDFYPDLEEFMQSSPVVALCVEGQNAISAVRLITGDTHAGEADAGTIRGDLAMGVCNVVHCSDSIENAKEEIDRFFNEDELYDYDKTEYLHVYMEDERE